MSRRLEHGGGLEDGKRKLARPLSTQEPIYVLLRSTRAKGRWAMDNRELAAEIRAIVNRQAGRCRIDVLQYVNEGNSLHFLLLVPSRACYLRFIRSVSGLVSRSVTGAERGRSNSAVKKTKRLTSKAKPKFWDVIPFSRISPGAKTLRQALTQIDREIRAELGLALGIVTGKKSDAKKSEAS